MASRKIIREIKTRYQAATSGDWEAEEDILGDIQIYANNSGPGKTGFSDITPFLGLDDTDLIFCVHAHKDIPYLLTVIEELQDAGKRI